MNFFGYEFRKIEDEEKREERAPSFVKRENEDGQVDIAAGGGYSTYIDLDGTIRTEAELVGRYREMAMQPEIDAAIDSIINEMIDIAEEEIISINLDDISILSDDIKKLVTKEFQNTLSLLNFNNKAYQIIRRWYVDGRLYYHAIIDQTKSQEGVKELRFVDPRKIRKIREITRKRVPGTQDNELTIPIVKNEYFIYNEKGFNYGNNSGGPAATGLKISKDSIVHCVSGLTDTNGSMVLSYLHKAIKAMNQLRTLEDALVIYRLARAPERRIWYIDVGNLPKIKAEQYVQDIMAKHKNRVIYNASTGEVRDDRKFMTMLEDFWLPRREGGKGTEVTNLPGGQNLGQMDDVLYFQKRLYSTLNVPVNRLNSDALFSIGRATEVTRDEVIFSKFITRMRAQFSSLFLKIMEKQVVLKQIMTLEDWQRLEPKIKFNFAKDNYFTELKDAEIYENRANLVGLYEQSGLVGRYVSPQWVQRTLLKQSEEEVERMQEEIAIAETEMPELLQPPTGPEGPPGDDGGDPGDPAAGGGPPGADGGDDKSKMAKIQAAKLRYKQLKEKGSNRSLQDESEFKKVTQIVARNKAPGTS
jgi:hypothetical protein